MKTYKEAMEFVRKEIERRIVEMTRMKIDAGLAGNKVARAAAENFRNGLVECHSLVGAMMDLVEMAEGAAKDAKTAVVMNGSDGLGGAAGSSN